MHDPKFERAVQKKMEGLEFAPSESVWTNVEKAVAKRKERRAVPLFWWLLAPGLLLLGAGAYYLRPVSGKTGIDVPAAAVTAKTQTMPHEKTVIPRDQASTEIKEGDGAGQQAVIEGQQKAVKGNERGSESMPAVTGGHLMTDADKEAAGGGYVTEGGSAGAPLEENTAITTRKAFGYRPGLITSIFAFPGIRAPRISSVSGNPSLAVNGLPRPKRPWAVGFAGGAGLSSFNESPLHKVATLYSGNSLNIAGTPLANSAKRYTSTIQPDISYWAGISAQKPLSSRWSLSLGLDLHYYSYRLRTGELVNNYVAVPASLIYSPAVAAVQTYPYYSTGNQQMYTNRYYYLELPVAMQWQITRSRTLPLFWRGGLSLSHLMSSNALYYDTHSGVYFKDHGVINHTQLGVSTAVMASLPVGGVRVQAGPEVQYAVNSLLKAKTGDGHLFYGGIRLVVLPGK